MYDSIVKWIKNHLISTPNCSAEYDQEFDNLHKRIKGYSSTATITTKPTAPKENLIEMDLEIGGKRVKVSKIARVVDEKLKNRTNIVLANETGDVLKHLQATDSRRGASKYGQGTSGTRSRLPVAIQKFPSKGPLPTTKSKTELTHKELMSQECTKRQTERIEELNRERDEDDEDAEILGIPLPFRSVGERSSLTDLHNLLEQCPQPQPPLLNKQLKTLQLNADQAVIMTEQVKKMKTGMENLQEIIKKFNCTEKFKHDIDFIIANVGPALARSEQMRQSARALNDAEMEKKQKKAG